MAQRDYEELFHPDFFPKPSTYLPLFPDMKSILKRLKPVRSECVQYGMRSFLAWVDFTLEHPDEVWEIDDQVGKKVYHYLNFLEREGRPPAFVVEVCAFDDFTHVNGYSLVFREIDLARLRNSTCVFSRSGEWDREQLVRSLNEQALLKYEEDRLDEARSLIDSAIRLSAHKSAYLLNNRGLICWKMSNTDQAKRDFLESINLDASNGDAYFNMGLIYFDEEDYQRALYYLRRAVGINPADSQFLTELGHLYLELEKENEALQLFRKACEHDPLDSQVDFHLGYYFLYKKGNPKHAVKYYDSGLEKDPEDQFALADLAVAHWILGHKKKSREISRLLQGKKRLMPYTVSRLVYLNVEMEDYDLALQYYQQALTQTEPFEPEWLHYQAALIYVKTGRSKEALDSLNLAVEVGGEPVIRRAKSDKALRDLKATPDFKRLMKYNARRRNR